MEIFRLREPLCDDFRSDNFAVKFDKAAVRLVGEYELAYSGDEEWVADAEDDREKDLNA
jgi:hypothetical protein